MLQDLILIFLYCSRGGDIWFAYICYKRVLVALCDCRRLRFWRAQLHLICGWDLCLLRFHIQLIISSNFSMPWLVFGLKHGLNIRLDLQELVVHYWFSGLLQGLWIILGIPHNLERHSLLLRLIIHLLRDTVSFKHSLLRSALIFLLDQLLQPDFFFLGVCWEYP